MANTTDFEDRAYTPIVGDPPVWQPDPYIFPPEKTDPLCPNPFQTSNPMWNTNPLHYTFPANIVSGFSPAVIERPGQLHFVIGVQRSGKSTFCTKWSQRRPDAFPRAIVCDDEIRLAVHGERHRWQSEPIVFGIEVYFIRALLNRHDVIVDETHTTERSILKVLTIDPNATWHLIDTPLQVCIDRAHETKQSDLIPHIRRCHAQLEELKQYGIEKKIDELREVAKTRRY